MAWRRGGKCYLCRYLGTSYLQQQGDVKLFLVSSLIIQKTTLNFSEVQFFMRENVLVKLTVCKAKGQES